MPTGSQNIEALIERVENQGTAIRGLAEETSNQIRDSRSDMVRSLTELQAGLTRVATEQSSAVKALEAKVDTGAATAAERTRPQYAALFGGMLGAVGLAVTIIQWQSGLRDKPVDDKLAVLTQSIADLARNTNTAFTEVKTSTISQGEFRLTTDFEKQISDLKTANRLAVEDRIATELDRLMVNTIPRAEDAEHWKGQERRDIADEAELGRVRERLNDSIKRFDALSPTNDVLRDLADRQRDLDAKIGSLKQSLIPTGSAVLKAP